jgi:hypothetical protein
LSTLNDDFGNEQGQVVMLLRGDWKKWADFLQAEATLNGVSLEPITSGIRVKFPCGFTFLPIPPGLGNQFGKCGGATGLASGLLLRARQALQICQANMKTKLILRKNIQKLNAQMVKCLYIWY